MGFRTEDAVGLSDLLSVVFVTLVFLVVASLLIVRYKAKIQSFFYVRKTEKKLFVVDSVRIDMFTVGHLILVDGEKIFVVSGKKGVSLTKLSSNDVVSEKISDNS